MIQRHAVHILWIMAIGFAALTAAVIKHFEVSFGIDLPTEIETAVHTGVAMAVGFATGFVTTYWAPANKPMDPKP